MLGRIFRSRIGTAVVASVITAGVVGGIAYAVTVVPPSPTDRYYACVSSAGLVKASTIKLNVQPTSCPATADTVRSWNAQGPQGVQGLPGPQGDAGPQGAAAPAKQTRTIHVQDSVPITMQGPSPNFGLPFEFHDCASIENITAQTSSHPTNMVDLGVELWASLPGGPTKAYPAFSSGLSGTSSPTIWTSGTAPGPDRHATALQLVVNGSTSPVTPGGTTTVTDVWITCVTF